MKHSHSIKRALKTGLILSASNNYFSIKSFVFQFLGAASVQKIHKEMASSNQFLITLAIISVVLPTVAFATEFKVGDASGWTVGFDYAAWAEDKEFYVGDKLGKTSPSIDQTLKKSHCILKMVMF